MASVTVTSMQLKYLKVASMTITFCITAGDEEFESLSKSQRVLARQRFLKSIKTEEPPPKRQKLQSSGDEGKY